MAFTDEEIEAVWKKGRIINKDVADTFRKDAADAWIARDQYGKETDYGWEIDHVYPESLGGDDDLINLRPMHWQNNRSKGDDYPKYNVKVQSSRTANVEVKNVTKIVQQDLQKSLKVKYKIK